MGRFVPKGEFWGEYEGAGASPFTGPMVVIIDAGVRSAGETVAGLFLEESRAYGLGDTPTAGMSAAKTTLPLPSGLCSVRFAVRTHMGRYNRGRGIEGIGLTPLEQLPYDPVELRAGVDTQIRRAEALLRGGFPEDAVDYLPPDRRKPD
jgi:C-terminal processing protease CtpA/Prc